LGSPNHQAAQADPGALPFVGRADAERLLRSALADTAGGAGGCLVVEGPAGIGKSRVLAEATGWSARLGVTVAAGRATELDRVAPLTTLLTSLSGCEPAVLREAELTGLAEREDGRFWLVDRLAALIEAYSSGRPLLISLDDVQWADELTTLALRVLVPALGSAPVLWLLARRRLPARSPAQRAVDTLVADGARVLPLRPLPDPAVAELCAAALGASPGASLLALAGGVGGNPFLLERLLTTLRNGGRLRIEDGVVTATDVGLPGGFLAAVNHRLRDLSRDARRLLDAGSVLGRPFTLHEAAGVLDEQPAGLLDAAGEAAAAETLVATGHTLAFREDLVREAVYRGLSGPARHALHRTGAEVGRAEDPPAVEGAGRPGAAAGPDDAGKRPAGRPKTGWASLTEAQLRVARLVAEGGTNRQIADRLFLSPHTVDSHIRHAFAKLGVTSRVELTRLALANDQPRRRPRRRVGRKSREHVMPAALTTGQA
jgi:DNA-binding CsgD family transcriptional regulator/predicted ATPase